MSRFRVVNDKAEEVRQAFLNRPRLVEDAPGFLDLEVLTDNEDASCFYLLTRWINLPAYRAWHSGEAHRQSHQGIPPGLKLDPSFTKVLALNPIAGDSADGTAPRSEGKSSSLAEILESSQNIPYLQITSQGEISKCNPATLLQLRRTEVQVIGRKIWDFLTAPDAEWLRACIATLRRGQNEKRLLNFVDVNTSPFSLACTVSAQPSGFSLLGEPVIEPERLLSNELLQLNNQVALLARESALQKKALARTNAELEKALKDLQTSYWHIQKIQDVLPICMECGKVKNAQSRWEDVAEYLSKHFPMFSHGYCPECFERAMSDLDKKSSRGDKK
jgi:quinol monooxygenase YgiN